MDARYTPMSFTLLMSPKFISLLDDGTPNSGGKVYTYHAGTTTPLTTYKETGLITANTNPIILDASGQADLWVSGPYKIVVADSDSVQLYVADNLYGLAGGATASLPGQSEGKLLAWSGTDGVFINTDLNLRALRVPEADFDAGLPNVAGRAGCVITFDGNGFPQMINTEAFIASVNDGENWGLVTEPSTITDDWGSV
jgi:hypothetical protein